MLQFITDLGDVFESSRSVPGTLVAVEVEVNGFRLKNVQFSCQAVNCADVTLVQTVRHVGVRCLIVRSMKVITGFLDSFEAVRDRVEYVVFSFDINVDMIEQITNRVLFCP